jgi:hypothetical protein
MDGDREKEASETKVSVVRVYWHSSASPHIPVLY